MELQSTDSKKVFKVFDASKRKRTRKKREGVDDSNSVVTDDSNNGCQGNVARIMSEKASLQDMRVVRNDDGLQNTDLPPRDKSSSSAIHRKSPRRHRRPMRDGLSLALKAGMASTPRSVSPTQDGEEGAEAPTQEHDSFIYAFLEEAIKRDKKKHRHNRRQEDHRSSRDREESPGREHRHHHHCREKHRKDESPTPAIDQKTLIETFAKICAKMNDNFPNNNNSAVQRTQSHKSLQCEVRSRREIFSAERRPERLSPSPSAETPPHIRSQRNCRHARSRSRDKTESRHKCSCHADKDKNYAKESKYTSKMDYTEPKYESKIDVNRSGALVNSRMQEDRYHVYAPDAVATRTFVDHYRDRPRDCRDCREYERRSYEDERRRFVEQKTSRSFEVPRDGYEDERCRRTSRSDTKDKRYDDKYYEKHAVEAPERHFTMKERRARRPSDRLERNSVVSKDDDRDRYSERERDSGLSVADGDTSTLSGRTGKSNYLKVVKQEIAEQRDTMDKMMKLWKELMRCFKGISQTQESKNLNESACENVRESAAAQLRLWRECMRRYETVARDVGDTDARLMEEINKQRSEMSEMATMWQECLQRYRDMSNDFNTLKQRLATAESPSRLSAGPQPPASAEGEGSATAPLYRLPHNYPPQVLIPPQGYGGSPLRGRMSAPPAWWWGGERRSPRRRSSRRSSPDDRDAPDTDRDRRRRNKDRRDVTRYKEKSSKPSAARSDHRRRKR